MRLFPFNPGRRDTARLSLASVIAVLMFLLSPTARADGGLDLGQYRGKVVYVDFWASWCSTCRQSFPWMNHLQASFATRGLVVLGINVDENPQDAATFLRQNPADFSVIYDPRGKLAEQMNVPGMPTSFIVDRDGKVVTRRVGFRTAEEQAYEADIEHLLAQK